jgi:hypothetical protein
MNIAAADALPQRGLEACGSAVLSQKIAKRLIGHRLKVDAPIARQERQSLQGLFVELNTFAGHGTARSIKGRTLLLNSAEGKFGIADRLVDEASHCGYISFKCLGALPWLNGVSWRLG